jgi:type I restriction enzyme S subunit
MQAADHSIKHTVIGPIPADWNIVTGGDMFQFVNGQPHENLVTEHGKYVVVNSRFIATAGVSRKYARECLAPCHEGDILMVMSDIPNGRALAKCYLVDRDDTYAVNQRICRLKPRGIYPPYAFLVLDRNAYYLGFNDGVNQTNLRRSDVMGCPIAIPPTLNEQTAIAEVIGDTDAWLGAQDRLITKKRALKAALMAELLLPRKRLVGYSEAWQRVVLGDIAALYQPVTISQDVFTSTGYPVYGANGQIGYCSKYNHETPQITISCRGNCGTVNITNGKAWITGNAMVVNCDRTPGVDQRFLYHLLCLQDFSALVTGSGQPQIVRGPLASFQLQLPSSIEEQRAIAALLDSVDEELTALSKRREKTQLIRHSLMRELLTGRVRLV